MPRFTWTPQLLQVLCRQLFSMMWEKQALYGQLSEPKVTPDMLRMAVMGAPVAPFQFTALSSAVTARPSHHRRASFRDL